jgi:hypothetical protein
MVSWGFQIRESRKRLVSPKKTTLRGLSMLILLARMQFHCFKNKPKIIPIPSELSLVNRFQIIKMRYDDVIVYL